MKATTNGPKATEIERVWRHFDGDNASVRNTIESVFSLSFAATQALLADHPRPRYMLEDDAFVLICRTINANPNEDPEDMVSLRMWCDGDLLITIAKRNAAVVSEVHAMLESGAARLEASEILIRLVEQLTSRIRLDIRELESATDELEDESLTQAGQAYQEKLKTLRHRTIWLKRFIEPQSEAFEDFLEAPPKWLAKPQLAKIREIHDATLRAVETIKTISEHTMVLQDHLNNQAEVATKRLNYLLTLIALIFFPINLLAGLLGANVGGIPGAHDPNGFLILCAIAASIGVAGVIIFRSLK